jgi:hypothetical protein
VLAIASAVFFAYPRRQDRDLPPPDVRTEIQQPDADVVSQLARAVAALGPSAPSLELNEHVSHLAELLATLANIERSRCLAYSDDLRLLAEGSGQKNEWLGAEACLDVLAQIPGNDAYLEQCLASANPRMQAAAIRALTNAPRPPVTDRVNRMRSSDPPLVVLQACADYFFAVACESEFESEFASDSSQTKRALVLIKVVAEGQPRFAGQQVDRMPLGRTPVLLWAVRKLREFDPSFLGECLTKYRPAGTGWMSWDAQESVTDYFDSAVKQAWLRSAGPRPERP